jgi:maltose O-acetyltransferase
MRAAHLRYVVQQETNGVQPLLHLALAFGKLLPDRFGNRSRAGALRLAGVRIGPGTVVGGAIRITGVGRCQDRLSIGDRGWINTGCFFDATDRIDIGDDVALAQQVLILTQTHELADPLRRAGALTAAPVTIGRGCWIGARAVILPGVTVGDGAVVAAGAVVTHDVPPHTLVGGVPAREIRQLDV